MPRLIPIVLVLITALTFWRLATNDFVLADDNVNILENPHFEKDVPTGIGHFWRQPYVQLYIPLTYTVWGLLVKLSFALGAADAPDEVPPALFHLTNVLLHICSTLLVYAILRRTLPQVPPLAAAIGAAIFAVHPLQVEAVAWATGLKDVLAAFFGLAAISAYLNFLRPDRSLESRRVFYVLGLVTLILSLLAKPSAVMVPFVAGILAVGLLETPWKKAARTLLPWLAPAAIVLIITRLAQPGHFAGFIPPLWLRPLVALDALWFYTEHLCFPYLLSPQYGRSPEFVLDRLTLPRTLFLFLPPLAAGIALWALRRKDKLSARIAGTGLAVCFASLLPVLGLVPFGFQRFSTVADRYSYFAMLGVSIGVAWLLGKLDRKLLYGAALLTVLAFAVRSEVQTRHWRDTYTYLDNAMRLRPDYHILYSIRGILETREKKYPEALKSFHDAIQRNPNHFDSHFNLGATKMLQERFSDAIPDLRRALELTPHDAEAQRHLADCLRETGSLEKALGHYETALELEPWSADSHSGYGHTLLLLKRYPDALPVLREAVRLSPNRVPPYLHLGNCLFHLDDLPNALRQYQTAAQLDPLHADAHFNIALTMESMGRADEALAPLGRAHALDPENDRIAVALGHLLKRLGMEREALETYESILKSQPDNLLAIHGYGWILAAGRDDSLRNGPKAVAVSREAIRTHGNDARLGDLLAAALAETGKFREAIDLLDSIIASLAHSESPDQDLLADLERHRDAYRKDTPWRE